MQGYNPIYRICSQEVQLVKRLSILTVALAVKNKRSRHLIIAFLHQSYLNLILDILNGNVVLDVQMANNL